MEIKLGKDEVVQIEIAHSSCPIEEIREMMPLDELLAQLAEEASELAGWSRIHRKSYNQNSDQRTEVLWCNFEVPSLFRMEDV